MKTVGKTTKPFRCNLNQIPYDYIVMVMNRFKGLDLIECLKNYGWRFVTLYRRQGSRPSPRKRNAKRLTEEALQIAVKRREVKGKGEKERCTHLNVEFKEQQREIRKPSSVISAKKLRKTIEWERLEISPRKLELPREYFMQRWAQ